MGLGPSEIFEVLSVETRVKMIELLKTHGPLGAKDIAATIGVTPAAASQHLKILRQAGLVRNERKGYWIPYSIDAEAMENCRQVLTKVCTCGCRGTGNFKDIQLKKSGLESLKQFEKELENELNTVRQRVNELESILK
jgi:DNA-binding transcriptional ArsR family regulator